jgi:hypothetical protein
MLKAGFNLGSTGNLGNGMVNNGTTKIYMKNGQKHRLNGPAEIHINGYEAWFLGGIKHRAGGEPAIKHPNGDLEFWENGKFLKKVIKSK